MRGGALSILALLATAAAESWPRFVPVNLNLGPKSRIRLVQELGQKNAWCNLEPQNSFRTTFRGQNVSAVLPIENGTAVQWVKWAKDGSEIKGGYMIDHLEEIARRGDFYWDLAVIEWYDPSAGEDADAWLDWAVDNFDVVAYRYTMTLERVNRVIRFSQPFIDVSPELVVLKQHSYPSFLMMLLSWTRPFSWQLWVAIAVSFCSTGFLYAHLEGGGEDIPKDSPLYHSQWLAFGAFTGAVGFSPSTGVGKLFVSSWMFAVLMIVSSYTANLASLLVVHGKTYVSINSVADADHKDLPICVKQGEYSANLLRRKYPMLLIKPALSNLAAIEDLRAGKCAGAIVPSLLWEVDKAKESFNYDCKLETVGRPFVHLRGGFCSKADAGENCTDLAVDVVTLLLHEMTMDDTNSKEKVKMLSSSHEVQCPSKAAGDTDEERLPLECMLGTFIMHAFVSVACFVIKHTQKKEEHHSSEDTEEELLSRSG